jgi:outer membrane protein OmpA-like peptidoglycan-associated protein
MTGCKAFGACAGAATLLLAGFAGGAEARAQADAPKTLTIQELRSNFPEAVAESAPAVLAVADPAATAAEEDCREDDAVNPDGTCALTLDTERGGRRFDTEYGGEVDRSAAKAVATPVRIAAAARPRPAGAPAKARARPVEARRGDLYIAFDTGSASLTQADEANLKVFAAFLAERPQARFLIEGHTDAVGGSDYNYGLSRRRALAVRDYVVSQGVSADRLEPRGFGFNRPRDASNPTSGVNRRVEASEIKND